MSNKSLRVLGLIAARAGSRGLRHKNIRKVAGVPLLVRAVELLADAARLGRRHREAWSVVLSTDSPRYARLARSAGAQVPVVRPAHLATDSARLIDVVLHMLDHLERDGRKFDLVVMASVTAPLTRVIDVRKALTLWRKSRKAVVSVVEESVHPSWRFGMRGQTLTGKGRTVLRRQEQAPSFVLNGALYAAAPSWLREHRQFVVTGETQGLVMPRHRSLDIETFHDLRLADQICLQLGDR